MKCAVCGRHDAAPLYQGLVKCRGCGFVWMDRNVPAEELKELYSNNYFFSGEYENYLEEEKPLTIDFAEQLRVLKQHVSGGKLLEIGAAYGFFLNVARPAFETTGVEINEAACQSARERFGLDMKHGDFLTMDFPANHFDAVVCWATLEHLQEPERYLEKIAQVLKPGGVFAFTTVDIGSVVARIRGRRWRQIHPPTHVSYFSRRTLQLLLTQCGFGIKRLWYVGTTRTVSNVLYSLFVLIYKKPAVFNFLKRLGLTKGHFKLNLYDTLAGVAVKK